MLNNLKMKIKKGDSEYLNDVLCKIFQGDRIELISTIGSTQSKLYKNLLKNQRLDNSHSDYDLFLYKHIREGEIVIALDRDKKSVSVYKENKDVQTTIFKYVKNWLELQHALVSLNGLYVLVTSLEDRPDNALCLVHNYKKCKVIMTTKWGPSDLTKSVYEAMNPKEAVKRSKSYDYRYHDILPPYHSVTQLQRMLNDTAKLYGFEQKIVISELLLC